MPAVEHDLERLLADAFRRASWRVHRQPSDGDKRPDLIVEGGGRRYVVELKASSEGRRDRLIPLLSQAILQARAYAPQLADEVIPVAVVGAEHIPPSVAESVKEFARRFAPGAAVGVIDLDGMLAFVGHGLEVLSATPAQPAHLRRQVTRLPHLFSDLNQWMLKVLLAQWIPADLLSAPRAHLRNASELANAARVSVMSAFRLVRQLANEGFLEEREGHLNLVRIPDLLGRWAAVRQPLREFPVRWIVKKDREGLRAALKSYVADPAAWVGRGRSRRRLTRPPRVCLALFAAADALECGFVHGVPPYVYLEREDLELLRRFGLSAEGGEHSPDAYVRIPANAESVFRAAVIREGVPASDIVQIWLDVSAHPSRGQAQAEQIRKRVFGPLFKKG